MSELFTNLCEAEDVAYELMKISVVVSEHRPDDDFMTIWDIAKRIYLKWMDGEDVHGFENAQSSLYAERYLNEGGN